jgi:hypothetical protein
MLSRARGRALFFSPAIDRGSPEPLTKITKETNHSSEILRSKIAQIPQMTEGEELRDEGDNGVTEPKHAAKAPVSPSFNLCHL